MLTKGGVVFSTHPFFPSLYFDRLSNREEGGALRLFFCTIGEHTMDSGAPAPLFINLAAADFTILFYHIKTILNILKIIVHVKLL